MSDTTKFNAKVIENNGILTAVKFNRGKSVYFDTANDTLFAKVGAGGKFVPAQQAVQQLPKFLRRKARKALAEAGFRKAAAATVRQ